MGGVIHRDTATLLAGLEDVRYSPADDGRLELVVRRPALGAREVLESVELTLEEGVAGDTWNQRRSRRTEDGRPHPDMQLNVINSRFSALISGAVDHRALAGDQLHVDLDLSADNLPAGTRLAIGTAIIEVTDQPHTGCAKFTQRFGLDAMRLVNSEVGKGLRLRGLNAKVVRPGTVTTGDTISKVVAAVAYGGGAGTLAATSGRIRLTSVPFEPSPGSGYTDGISIVLNVTSNEATDPADLQGGWPRCTTSPPPPAD